MDKTGLTYNTEKEQLVISEYGRNIQEMIKKLPDIEDRNVRTEAAKFVVNLVQPRYERTGDLHPC